MKLNNLSLFSLSFSAKIIFLITGMCLITSLSLGSFLFAKTSKMAVRMQEKELEAEVRAISPIFSSVFTQLRRDVKFLANTPSITGLTRSIQNSGIDPTDHSTTEPWVKRLQDIFSSMILSRDSYVQIRFIGVADNGRELVRVNKRNGKVIAVPNSELQQKDNEFYFNEIIKYSAGEVYYSTVSLNREWGKIQEPFQPVIRVAIPIHDDDNNIFGMIIINAEYEIILREALENIESNKNLYIFDEAGNMLTYNNQTDDTVFHFRSGIQVFAKFPFLRQIIGSDVNSGNLNIDIDGKENAVSYSKAHYDPIRDDRLLLSVMSISKEELLNPVYEVQKEYMYLISALVMISLCLSAFFAYRQASPLKMMTSAIKGWSEEDEKIDLPVNLSDEIGDLARAFEKLIERLNKLREQEQKTAFRKSYLASIVETSEDAIISKSLEGIITSWNRGASRLFGFTPLEAIDQNISLIIPPEFMEEEKELIARIDARKSVQSMETKRLNKQGDLIDISLSASPIYNSNKAIVGISTIMRDISDRVKAEEEILRSNAELERFAYIASHDLQEPLRMVSNFTEILCDSYYNKKLDDEAKEYMEIIISSTKRMQDMVADLLEYSRVGSKEGNLTVVDSRKHIDLALENLHEVIVEANAVIEVDKNLPMISMYPSKFTSLIQNLIGNALKYRDESRVSKVCIHCDEHGSVWQFTIKDNGIGMKKEYLEQIFVIFKRLHSKDEYSGTGIGLAICKKIVDSFGGDIWVESEYGKGSIFYFTVPKVKKNEKGA